ncbi:hypothetical protein DFH08DRAFT_437494 [Mycena albidolilacea]|uniref:Uncharacterized protein n=1 Tax=Mycena albidolilacea TaxID=1033008 RepID=A0AAD7AG28_9AGAR|nr:hypothetical protein DFH08DRAFT_437494 [Mycena albidolilacea]
MYRVTAVPSSYSRSLASTTASRSVSCRGVESGERRTGRGMDGEGPKRRGDVGGDTNEGRQRGAEAGIHALPLLARSSFFPLCMTSIASALNSTVANSHTRAVLQSRGACSSARALSVLAGRLILITLNSPRSRKDKHVGRRQLTAAYRGFQGPAHFIRVSHTSVYACGP